MNVTITPSQKGTQPPNRAKDRTMLKAIAIRTGTKGPGKIKAYVKEEDLEESVQILTDRLRDGESVVVREQAQVVVMTPDELRKSIDAKFAAAELAASGLSKLTDAERAALGIK